MLAWSFCSRTSFSLWGVWPLQQPLTLPFLSKAIAQICASILNLSNSPKLWRTHWHCFFILSWFFPSDSQENLKPLSAGVSHPVSSWQVSTVISKWRIYLQCCSTSPVSLNSYIFGLFSTKETFSVFLPSKEAHLKGCPFLPCVVTFQGRSLVIWDWPPR